MVWRMTGGAELTGEEWTALLRHEKTKRNAVLDRANPDWRWTTIRDLIRFAEAQLPLHMRRPPRTFPTNEPVVSADKTTSP
jgi:hypothetical protein